MPAVSKRGAALVILNILKQHSDPGHRLLQASLLAKLESEYDLRITRKTLKEHLNDLIEAGYPVEYDNGWYYEGEFCEAELDLLFASVLYNDFLTNSQRQDLLGKIRGMGSAYYRPRAFSNDVRSANPQFLYTLEVLQSAIDAAHQVQFQYAQYDTDKRLHPRVDDDGSQHVYLFNPYRIVVSNGRYYVIGNVDKYDNVAHFRLDKILECTERRASAKPQNQVRGLEGGLQIPEYMAGHAYMFTGKNVPVRLHISRRIAGDVLDWFGTGVRFENVTEDTADAVFHADEGSLYYWLKQYDEFAEKMPL